MPSDAANSSPLPSLALRSVWKHYRRGEEDIQAAADVSLELRAGSFTCILGPSGGGKSTLLHLMGGMDRPDEGEILVFGRDITHLKSDQLSAYRRSDVGFVFQSFHLLPTMTAAENVELPLAIAGVSLARRRERAKALLARVGLLDRAGHRPHQLSGGQAQRVAVARALAADPQIVLADEPTGNLDSQSGLEIMQLLKSIAHEDGRTVVVVTHNEEFIPFADRVVRIRDGRVHSDDVRTVSAAASAGHEARAASSVRFGTLARMALSAVRRRLGRATLTGLGIAVGVAATVLLMGLGSGLESGVVAGLTSFGPLTSITVSPQRVSGTTSPFAPNTAAGRTTPITPRSLGKFAALPGARGAYASVMFLTTLRAGGSNTMATILNLPPARLSSVSGLRPTLGAGAWPAGNGILVSSADAKALLGGKKPNPDKLIGRTVAVRPEGMSGGVFGGGTGLVMPPRRLPFATLRVTGIVTGNGANYIPYTLALSWVRQVSGSTSVTYPGATVIGRTITDVGPLAARIGKMGYGTTTVKQILKSITSSFSAIEAGLGVIGGIALVVAGLMISVIMSMSVLERRREIGILRAVGARRRDIARLFLTEVGSIGVGGGLVGLGLGAAAGEVINAVVSRNASFHGGIFHLPAWLLILGLVFGAAVSLIAGWIPAARAARLDPVTALHAE
ncbi:MAG: ABC transporter ATP-binding protein/permease [Bacilli bacterium]